MRAARYLPTKWVLTDRFKELSPNSQRLLFALWIWPEMPTAGLSITPPRHVGSAIGLTEKQTDHAIVELHQSGFVHRDDEAAIIWLCQYLETQLGRQPNAKDRIATAKTVKALPMTAMVRQFCHDYGITKADIDGLSYGVGHGLSTGHVRAYATDHTTGVNRLEKGKSLPVPSHPQCSAGSSFVEQSDEGGLR